MEKRNQKSQYKRKPRRTSMFFVLWSVFAAFALLLILATSITHRIVFRNTYRNEAVSTLAEKGQRVNAELRLPPPEGIGENYDGYLRYLSTREELLIYVLDTDGNVLIPREEDLEPDVNESETAESEKAESETTMSLQGLDFKVKIIRLKAELAMAGATSENGKGVVYSVSDGYVFAAAMPAFEGAEGDTYLYVFQSMQLVQAVENSLNLRMLWIAILVFVLSFLVSSAISGSLLRPVYEISEKAKRLALGDFEVDFHGKDYFEEMEALSASLNFAKDELSKADRLQKELIANVSHDFKTPLTMIKAYAEMIVEVVGENPEKRERSARVIIEEADRLTSLVSDVLDLSKIRSGIQALACERFDLQNCLKEILGRFDYLCDREGYLFDVEADGDAFTYADRQKIEQVLYNLIGNAVNYTGEDKRVNIRLKKEGEFFRFSVSDTGKGIPDEELADIWDRYYRTSQAHKRPVKGSGLGLSIVKTILERHSFAFGVESILDVGSTFYVLFPAAKEEIPSNEEK